MTLLHSSFWVIKTEAYKEIRFAFRIIMEVEIFALWIVTVICMCFPKGKNEKNLSESPPYAAWGMAFIFAGGEM